VAAPSARRDCAGRRLWIESRASVESLASSCCPDVRARSSVKRLQAAMSLPQTTLAMDASMMLGDTLNVDLSSFNIADFLNTPHNARLYQEVQKLKALINELVDFQAAHPLHKQAPTDSEKQVKTEIERKEKYIRAQLSIIKTLYRQSVLRVREEKANTADVKAVNDALILGLHNLKYEEQSLRSEISAAENYEYVQANTLRRGTKLTWPCSVTNT